VSFWVELIEKYLKPLEKDAEKEKQMGNALKELRNQVPMYTTKHNFSNFTHDCKILSQTCVNVLTNL
jgi:ribosomal protein S17E